MRPILMNKELFEPFFVGFLEIFSHSASDEEMEELKIFWSNFFSCIEKMDNETKHLTLGHFSNLLNKMVLALTQKCIVENDYLSYYGVHFLNLA